ncbi:phage tail tube protein [Polaromonas naphthalenivorans]|uniref:Uncharacterized protein n=1 Tax=Polaromonas naphthalenivorans (strain CJ2) TaxID=365044 RepID=A1VPH9_POLNA|nr:hypothetical protein [Polaromonas naphthalenivorans]ABM37557.1 conserved hypothetical protein [Polaromonas naphthalenivorans CJ2]
MSIIKQIYKPSMTVGQVYAKIFGSNALPLPIGNVLELGIEHDEDVKKQDDMTALGGGTHAEVRRIKEAKVTMKLADLNVVNMSRAIFGLASEKQAGVVVAEPHVATLGGLVRLAHIQPTAVTLKKGANAGAATEVLAPGNFEVRPEGIFINAEAAGLDDDELLWIDYTYGAYAVIEAMTTKAVELALTFGGLNEADGGKPVVVDIYRASQGITKKLALINKDFGALDVEGSILLDATKTGVGISRYYKVSMA